MKGWQKSTNQERIEAIKGNWEYEKCIKPEDVEWLIGTVEEQQEEIERLHEAFQYFKGVMESETYTDHIKCQDVVCVDDLRKGLIAFEALREDE